MAIIPIDNLEVGMVLKSEVCDRSGRMLLPSGGELTEKHLKIFRAWGVLAADIDGDDGIDVQRDFNNLDIDLIKLAAAESSVSRSFRHNDQEHPAIKELMRLCIMRKVTDVF